MINILLTDDHAVIRTGMKFILENRIPHSLIDEAEDGDSAFHKIKSKDYDLVILDVNMPNTDSFGLVENLLAMKPHLKILMFSMNDEEVYAKKYLKFGVMGYVKKDEGEEEITKAVTSVLNNKKYISAKLTQSLLDDIHHYQQENPFDKLSTREFEIAQHLMRGDSPLEICNKMALHSSTVGTHKARILQKLQCKNIIALNTLGQVYNILPPLS